MDTKKKREELQTTFNKVVAQIDQLIAYREQLKGKFALLNEMDEEKKEDKAKGNGSTKKVEN